MLAVGLPASGLADIRTSEIADLRRIARENGVLDLDGCDGPQDLRTAV